MAGFLCAVGQLFAFASLLDLPFYTCLFARAMCCRCVAKKHDIKPLAVRLAGEGREGIYSSVAKFAIKPESFSLISLGDGSKSL